MCVRLGGSQNIKASRLIVNTNQAQGNMTVAWRSRNYQQLHLLQNGFGGAGGRRRPKKGKKSQKSFFLQLLTAAYPSSTSNANLRLLFYAGDVFTLPLQCTCLLPRTFSSWIQYLCNFPTLYLPKKLDPNDDGKLR